MGLIFLFSYRRLPKVEPTRAIMAQRPSGSSWPTFVLVRESTLEAEPDHQWLPQGASPLLQHPKRGEPVRLVVPHLFFQAILVIPLVANNIALG